MKIDLLQEFYHDVNQHSRQLTNVELAAYSLKLLYTDM